MPSGIIQVSNLPGWPAPLPGLAAAAEAAGIGWVHGPDGIHVSDIAAANAIISGYAGSTAQLTLAKSLKQSALDTLFDANFDLSKFIRGGTAVTITAGNVGAFLATITNNYRSLRISVANAVDLATVNAINVSAGWPSNP